MPKTAEAIEKTLYMMYTLLNELSITHLRCFNRCQC